MVQTDALEGVTFYAINQSQFPELGKLYLDNWNSLIAKLKHDLHTYRMMNAPVESEQAAVQS